ncbi:30S ribosomal protein S7 [Ichthyobacterium seriolicida]|uniref:Small ribosomal subunit protein uS7 n=1 Tax=Ichthyobacterium seriolicida TaxID=242600 RepID=A0A1J1E1H5_9FLAO|nr:30S ribosomal protein S7 [Ichthyobacterium seriolicida]BAV94805.1 30S ribosomal protein S7 [Ichthyobacterium seriolicida]
MRKGRVKRRELFPDPKYGDELVTKFVNNLMYSGKKSLAYRIFYDALSIVEEKTTDDEKTSLEIWKSALDNVTPYVEVKSKRVGGAVYQVPVQISSGRRISMAIKWMISFSRKRNEKSMSDKLASEILAAYKQEGSSFKKKTDVHKMAESNKAFSHFRF